MLSILIFHAQDCFVSLFAHATGTTSMPDNAAGTALKQVTPHDLEALHVHACMRA